ncbi:hypothetical protein M501DRAFT_1021280 [Patellaria atrata CBS 101060]|uniref:N-acetyltransferase domain-containing protein n=1 Tax=Patellaria atrata CBS 101060 TaxID=1346257 RepID=A0A9P4SH26_9PEZI|nr:hypothetical protein M501DRAFT_1021280 [Patellaria atrata CBS 101060]
MLLNAHIAGVADHVLLVPYCAHHVPTYHEWMQDEELRQATASEPLSLLAEYAMQQSWRADGDKLTFIVCACDQGISETLSGVGGIKASDGYDAPEKMIGDVNLFLCEDDRDWDLDDDGKGKGGLVGEIELMIASKVRQGKGYGKAALSAFLAFVARWEEAICADFDGRKGRGLEYLRVKVGRGNVRSIGLFEKFGFTKVSEEPNYFGEFELRRGVGDREKGEDGNIRVIEYREE